LIDNIESKAFERYLTNHKKSKCPHDFFGDSNFTLL
jgi:hypothetical protein